MFLMEFHGISMILMKFHGFSMIFEATPSHPGEEKNKAGRGFKIKPSSFQQYFLSRRGRFINLKMGQQQR